MILPPGWRFSITVRITQNVEEFPFVVEFRIISGLAETGTAPRDACRRNVTGAAAPGA
jgi:hypothetical protein